MLIHWQYLLREGNEMKNRVDNVLVHRFIITDYAIRTLEVDSTTIEKMNKLRTKEVTLKFYERLLYILRGEMVLIKREMSQLQLKKTKEYKTNEYVICFEFHQGSLVESFHYAIHALRNKTYELIQFHTDRLINIE